MERGFVQVYTGNGKGKTTAAFGLALRALCAGKTVYIGQFIKGMKYSETAVVEKFEGIKIEQFGNGCYIQTRPSEADCIEARKWLDYCGEILRRGEYDIVILDEIFIATYFHMFSWEEVIAILEKRAPAVEVILTGRYAPLELIEYADLVTEMTELKHYYQKGVLSRKGIDC